MLKLSVSNLESGQMGEAYLLIRHVAPVGPERWAKFCRKLASSGGGVLAVRGEDECVHGVAAYLPVASLKHGRALKVEAIAAFEFGQSQLVRRTLSAALDKIARSKKCGAVMVSMDARGLCSPGSTRRAGWEALGLRAEIVEFVRHLDDPCSSAGQPL